jgi:hypothetical protein
MPEKLTTGEFLRTVLPSTGIYFAAKRPSYQHRGFYQEACDTIQDLAATVRGYNDNHLDSYFAVQSYLTTDNRRRDNVALIRSLWIDIDVGKPGAYTNLRTAHSALIDFCQNRADIAPPTVFVVSGYGIHAYWTLDRDLTPEAWHPLATRLQALAHHHHLLADHSVTVDFCRVLRPVGTSNYKRSPASPVSGHRLGPDLDPDELLAQLEQRCDELELDVGSYTPRRSVPLSGDLADLTAGIEDYPLADAEKIATACNVFKHMKATRGAEQDQTLWYHALLVLHRTTQREEVAHAWSMGHEDYEPSDVDDMLSRIEASDHKPARCETFRKDTALCQGCTLKVNSPIVLGMPEREHQPVIVNDDGTVDELGDMPETLKGLYRFRPRSGLEYCESDKPKSDEAEDPDTAAPAPWYRCSWQFPVPEFIWFDDTSDAWMVRLKAFIRSGDWSRSDLPLASFGQGGSTLLRDLAGRLRVLSVGPPKPLERYMKTWIDDLQRHTDTQRVVNHLGWQKDGSFLLGTTLYKPDGTTSSVAIGRKIAKYVEAHVAPPHANLDEYRRLTSALYNRPQYQPHQFALMSALGSVLLSLVWNGHVGIPISIWSNSSGLGKTTLAKIGLAAWGDPMGSGQTAKAEGATELALWTIAGQRRNMPVLFDEVTTWDGPRLRAFLYAYSDGTPKQQARAEGGLRDNDHLSWSNNVFVTANESVIGKIMTTNRNTAAQVARVFEYELPRIGEDGLDVTDQQLVDAVYRHYAVAGARFISAVVTRQAQVAAAVRKLVQHIHLATGVGTEARYWTHQVATAIVAGRMAKVLGIFDFDPESVYRWALDQIKLLSGQAEAACEDYEDSLADLIRDCYPGLIITLNEGRGTSSATYPPGVYPPRNVIHGRVILEQKRLYLAVGSVRAWCAKHGLDVRTFTNNLIDQGLLLPGLVKYSVGRGTNITAGRSSCYQLTGKAVVDAVNDLVEDHLDNVVRGRFARPQPEPNDVQETLDAAL